MIKKVSQLIFFVLLLLVFVPSIIKAQNDSIFHLKMAVDGYLETYYLYDFAQPADQTRPPFYVSHTRTNELNLNLGLIRFSAENKQVKTAFGLTTGTYVNANMVNEQGVIKNIYEANIAFKVSSKKNLWLQAGIFSSHLGFESAIGADCYNLTRSIAAENSPYYESGVRLNYKSNNEKWDLSLLVLNGWQKVKRLDNNNMPSFGSQITYTANTFLINNSNYFGNEGTDKLPVWRYFNNFYVVKKVTSKSTFILGFDIGTQYHVAKSLWQFWYSPQIAYRYNISKKIALAARMENFYDKDNAIVASPKATQFNVWGTACNVDFKIIKQVLFRIEYKLLNNQDKIFTMNARASSYNSSIAGAFTVKF